MDMTSPTLIHLVQGTQIMYSAVHKEAPILNLKLVSSSPAWSSIFSTKYFLKHLVFKHRNVYAQNDLSTNVCSIINKLTEMSTLLPE